MYGKERTDPYVGMADEHPPGRLSPIRGEGDDLREENKKLLDQLVAAEFRDVELAQALQADPAVTP